MACLILPAGARPDSEGEYYPLGQRTTVVGRDESLPIQILNDQRVSRRHLSIRFEPSDQTYRALDMRSSNGVFINGRRVTVETSLVDGDEIRIGDTTMVFTMTDFADKQSAMAHYKQVGQRKRSTLIR